MQGGGSGKGVPRTARRGLVALRRGAGRQPEQRDAVLRAYEVAPWAGARARLDLVEAWSEDEWVVLWLRRRP